MVALDSSHATIRPSFFGADASDPATPEEANDNSLSLHGSALSDMVELRLVLDLLSNSKEERLTLAARAEFHGPTFQAELLAQSFRNFMPSWMILPSGRPTLSRSRPS